MKGLSLRSRAGSLVCPLCEGHKLKARGHNSARCDSCGGIVSGATLEALRQITALPDALGSHACECGHPEMRRLPDGTRQTGETNVSGNQPLRPHLQRHENVGRTAELWKDIPLFCPKVGTR